MTFYEWYRLDNEKSSSHMVIKNKRTDPDVLLTMCGMLLVAGWKKATYTNQKCPLCKRAWLEAQKKQR